MYIWIIKIFHRYTVSFIAWKCPNTEFFLVLIFLYSDWIRENTDQKKLRIWTLHIVVHFQLLFSSQESHLKISCASPISCQCSHLFVMWEFLLWLYIYSKITFWVIFVVSIICYAVGYSLQSLLLMWSEFKRII